MKKFFSILAFVAILSVSCEKGEESVPFPKAVNKDYHMTVILDAPYNQMPLPLPSGEQDCLLQLEFHSSSTGLAVFKESDPMPFEYSVQSVPSKAALVGTTYQILDLGTLSVVSVDGQDIVLDANLENMQPISIRGQIQAESVVPSMADAYRGWKIQETWISVTGDGVSADLGIAKRFDGCNINVISKYVRDKGVNIDVLSDSYNVKKLLLGENGKFAIIFDAEDPYYGDYELSTESFSYRFTHYNDDDPIIAASANGKMSLLKNGKGRLELFGTLTEKSGKKYNVSVVFFMGAE